MQNQVQPPNTLNFNSNSFGFSINNSMSTGNTNINFDSENLINSLPFNKPTMMNLDDNNLDHVFGNNKTCLIKNEIREKSCSSPIQKVNSIQNVSNQRKRTRANADQLAILEEAFTNNSSPNSRAREILAEKVNMSERSVQIWFQNRRAKVKLMQKRSYTLQEEAMKHQLYNNNNYLNNLEYHSSPFALQYNGTFGMVNSIDTLISGSPNLNNNDNAMFTNEFNQKCIQPRSLSLDSISSNFLNSNVHGDKNNSILGEIRCEVLNIGSWRRKTVQKGDLQCIYNLSQRLLTWRISDNGLKFKMEIPFSAIVSINLKPIENGMNQACVIFDTNQVPSFFMETNFHGQLVWSPCQDFTENMQASRFFKHSLFGPLDLLLNDIIELTSKDINLRNTAKIPEDLIKKDFNTSEPSIKEQFLKMDEYNSEEHYQELFRLEKASSYPTLS